MLAAFRNGSCAPAKGTPVNRLFERFIDDAFFASPAASRTLAHWEDEQSFTIELDVPGVAEQDVELSVHNGEIVIQVVRTPVREGGHDHRRYGKFEQRIALPTAVDTDRITAKLANGVLALIVPKSEAAKPRKITVQG